ncbi:MAG: UDP-glucose 4-epimerase [Bradymonadia bacterium]|jgi:UDP-glucose 4-epimerase
MISGETILLTGGAGFIGSHLVEALLPHNHLHVFDTFRRHPVESHPLRDHDNVTFFQGDVRDMDGLRNASNGVTRVLHLASVAGVSTVLNNPSLTMNVAIQGTTNILELARENPSIKRVITYSTSEVFGSHALNVTENDPTPLGPVSESRWTYAASKIASEHLAMSYGREFGVPAVSLRPFNVYGPGQVGEGAIHNFIARAIRNEPIIVNNDGRQIRSWCYVSDMVDGTLRALESEQSVGEAFNIGNPQATITVVRLAELIVRLAGSSSKIEYRKRDYPDVEVRLPNIDKAREYLAFEPRVSMEDGIARTIAWYREQLT